MVIDERRRRSRESVGDSFDITRLLPVGSVTPAEPAPCVKAVGRSHGSHASPIDARAPKTAR